MFVRRCTWLCWVLLWMGALVVPWGCPSPPVGNDGSVAETPIRDGSEPTVAERSSQEKAKPEQRDSGAKEAPQEAPPERRVPTRQSALTPLGNAGLKGAVDIRDIALRADGQRAVLCSALQGLLVMDISTPSSPKQVASAKSSLDKGIPRCHRVFVVGERVVTLHQGDDDQPDAFLAVYSWDGEQPKESFVQAAAKGAHWYGVAVAEKQFYIAAGKAGVLVFAEGPQGLTPGQSSTDATNARDIALVGKHLIVADGAGGIKLLTADDTPKQVGSLALDGYAQRVHAPAGQTTRVYVSLGGGGVAIIDVSDPAKPVLLGTSKTSFGAMAAVVSGNSLLVADGAAVRVHDVKDPKKPRLVGSIAYPAAEPEPLLSPRHAAIAVKGDVIWLGERDQLHALRFADTNGPIMELSRSQIYFAEVKANEQKAFALIIYNRGARDLTISKMTASPSIVTLDRASFVVKPGEFDIVEIYVKPTDTKAIKGSLQISSDDPTQPQVSLPIWINQPLRATGDTHPNVRWPDVDGRMYTIEQLKGKAVLLAYYATW